MPSWGVHLITHNIIVKALSPTFKLIAKKHGHSKRENYLAWKIHPTITYVRCVYNVAIIASIKGLRAYQKTTLLTETVFSGDIV
jgi:hypothetical protein